MGVMMNAFAQALSAALEYAIVSAQVWEEGAAVGFLYREAAVFEQDSGWRFFSGEEDDDYANQTEHFHTVPLREVLAQHPDVAHLMSHSAGAWEWDDASGQFVAVADWSPESVA